MNESINVDKSRLGNEIRAWYLKEYSFDSDIGEELVPGYTFGDMFRDMEKGDIDYEYFAEDSVVRERCFEELADILGVDYDDVYEAWVSDKPIMHKVKVSIDESVAEGAEKMNLNESSSDSFEFKAYITNLGKYNEGELVGEWVEFPIDEDDFNKILKKIGISDEPNEDGMYYEEWFVTDYECDLPGFDWSDLGEYPSYNTLQEFGELCEKANESGNSEAISDAFEYTGDLKEAIDGIESGDLMFLKDVNTDADLGSYFIDELYGGEIPKELAERYFDYEQLGRDLDLEYYAEDDMPETAGEYYCGDENATDYDIGAAFVEEVGLDGVGNLDFYFDYDGYGRDIRYEGAMFTTHGCIVSW